MIAPQCPSLQPVTIIHENKWFSLVNRGGYYILEYHRPQVLILPVVDNHSIVMVRVKRPVIADNALELPAGGAKENEAPLEAVAREFQEETGIKIDRIDRFQLLPSIAISPNRYPVLPWIYQVDLSKQEFDTRDPHDDEVVSVECFTFIEVKEKIIQGEIYVSLPMAVIGRFLFSQTEIVSR
jgi:8-oxo-dGTP pyrophosphatase MutT (NUDIX family)